MDEARLAAIEARLDALERRPPDRTTMKELRRCPACGCAKLLHTDRVLADVELSMPLAISNVQRPSGRLRTQGRLEAHACTKCGLVEWHALELEPSILDNPHVKLIEPPDAPEGPYR